MRQAILAALMCATALAACGKSNDKVIVEAPPPDTGGSDAPDTPPAAVTAAAPEAAEPAAPAPVAGGAPVRKSGLWQITSTNERGTRTGTLCVSEATEARRGVFSNIGGGGQRRPQGADGGNERQGPPPGAGGGRGGGAECQPKIAKTGSGWTATSACDRNFGEVSMKMSSRQTLTGDLASHYTIKGERTVSGSPREEMNGTHPIAVSGVYKGACPAGQKPGDYTGEDGEVRNILQPRGG